MKLYINYNDKHFRSTKFWNDGLVKIGFVWPACQQVSDSVVGLFRQRGQPLQQRQPLSDSHVQPKTICPIRSPDNPLLW